MVDAWSFLYDDPDPLQAGVAPNTIDIVRAALIVGYVFEPDGAPKPLANVSVLGHPELGTTITDGKKIASFRSAPGRRRGSINTSSTCGLRS